MVETEASAAATPRIEDWTQTPWRTLERHVYRLQKRIYRAQCRGNVKAVHSLQRLLMKSRAGRTLAVRRVTQDNQGKKTAGVDGVKAVGPMVRLLFVARLREHRTIQARPVRRVLIPKPGKDERRPLGIPAMLDRAHQALAKLALEPQWEARFEPNSFGFRPGRSCHDAIAAIFDAIGQKAKYALDADIKGCFDHIDHRALLDKLDTIPAIHRAVKAWLQAGVLVGADFTPTTSGTPQGGVISPLLANIALHGMEEVVAQAYWRRQGNLRTRPMLVRYADDLVILCADLDGITAARAALEQWLAGMGLHLSPTKTRVTHTLHAHEGNLGFDFLGFTVRQFPVGRTHSGKNRAGQRLGFKTHIKPSNEAVKRHMASIRALVRKNLSVPQEALIRKLNPVIRGWANYYRTVVATGAFNDCDSQVFAQLWSWARRRHPGKGRAWRAHRYWNMQPGARWAFVAREDGEVTRRLRSHTDSHIRRHVKVKGRATPFDGNLLYWAGRLQRHPLLGTTRGILLQRQHGRCPACGLTFMDGDLIEVDHCIPRAAGGHDGVSNKQALHHHCHDQKTAEEHR